MDRFVVRESTRIRRYLIECEASHVHWTRLEELKAQIRAGRAVPYDGVDSYTWAEVAAFLDLAQEIR